MLDVKRADQAPASLAKKKSYKGKDVLQALYGAFLGKCYLCETPVEVGSFEVDHRKPKDDEQFPELAFEWTNLFPACAKHRCNQRRERSWPNGGLLDPSGGHQVEQRVLQRIEGVPSMSLREGGSVGFLFYAPDASDVAAANTAKELDRIHNGQALQAAVLRKAIAEHICTVATAVMDYVTTSSTPADDRGHVEELRARVQKLVSRSAPYTMLVRSYFERYEAVRALFD